MAPKKKAVEGPKKTVEEVRKQYEPKQEAMRNEIAVLKQAIELASARKHATVIDLELARDRKVLTEGRLESKKEVLESTMESRRKLIEDTTDKAQEVKGSAHIKNIRVQMLSKERDEYVKNRKVPEEVLKAEQLRKDLDAFYAANPHVASFINDREDALRKTEEREEAVKVYKTAMDGNASIITSPDVSQIKPDHMAMNPKNSTTSYHSTSAIVQQSETQINQVKQPPHVDPAVLTALDAEIQRFSAELAERSHKLGAIRRTEALVGLIESQQLAIKKSKIEKRNEISANGNQHGVFVLPSSVVDHETKESQRVKSTAPLQLTYIHGNSAFDYNGAMPASVAIGITGTPLTEAPSPCEELVQTLQLKCGFALCCEHKGLSRHQLHVASTIRNAIRRAMTSPSGPHTVPLVVVEGFVKTRNMSPRVGTAAIGSLSELVIMCDPLSDVNDTQQVVPLNDLLCEVLTAAPTTWDQGTILLELAPADEGTQGLAILAHRGSYLKNGSDGSSIVFQYHAIPAAVDALIQESALGSTKPKLLMGKVGNSHCGLLASLITYLIRDSASPAASINTVTLIEALRGALDNPSPHSLFASIGRVLRPAQQRSEVATVLCIPPQLVRQSTRNPHRTLFGPERQAVVTGNLMVLAPPATGKLGAPRPWVCVARAEGNKTVFERIRRQLKDRELAARKLVNNGIEDRSRSTFSIATDAPFVPEEPNSAIFLPVIIAQAANALEYQNRLTADICSREERMLFLRNSLQAAPTTAEATPAPSDLLTWMSKKALEDTNQQVAQLQNQHFKQHGQYEATMVGNDNLVSTSSSPSAVRAKLLASVSSARNRSALEIHVSGAALSDVVTGDFRLILVRKDISALTSVAGMALFDDSDGIARLLGRLFDSTVRQPLVRRKSIASASSVDIACSFVEEPHEHKSVNSAPPVTSGRATLISAVSGGVYVVKGKVPTTVDDITRDTLLTDFVASVCAACRDPQPPSEDTQREPLSTNTHSPSSAASPTAVTPLTHLACEQPWVFLNNVTITARDGLCKSLVGLALRDSIAFTEWVDEKEYAARFEHIRKVRAEAAERAQQSLELKKAAQQNNLANNDEEINTTKSKEQSHLPPLPQPLGTDTSRQSISYSIKDVSFVGAEASRLDLSRPQSALEGIAKPIPGTASLGTARPPHATEHKDHHDVADNEVRNIIKSAPETDKRFDADDFED